MNCLHLFPDLVRLEKKYPNQVVVLGVHTAKFDNEKDPKSIEKAMQRYELNHPVLNDADRKIWTAYGVEGWPSVGIIDPEGFLVKAYPGQEHIFSDADRVISQLIRVHRANKTLNEKPIYFTKAQAEKAAKSPLWFPGKVLADGRGNRLFISDSTHHRIVITDLDGKKIAVVGTGKAGHDNGDFDKASFNDPQGLALRGDILYVADRKNHLIRALDLRRHTVKRIAGIGHQGTDIRRGGLALNTGLNSPWGLLLHGGELYIAMAGHHQIWVMNLAKHAVVPFAGTGIENLMDGPRASACFAQPSGLASDGRKLYVADSEVSAVRAIPLDGSGEVSTLVGAGLFEFGDVDGVGPTARLQHALGIVYVNGKLYVADTYNSKIKVIDPGTRSCKTFVGGDKKAKLFNEPGGISHADGKLYVADTNAHRIQVIDLETKAVSTLKLQGVEP
ncbi:MAG TPA: thioredoxin-like domain-containing protein, partial [Gemmataceae bacterium]|nr:thioredoxin-like domain-containing protein [Gemmataceae bacterium]